MLIDDSTNLRQWTVRCASRAALFCICSSFTSKERPEIYESDFAQLPKSGSVKVKHVERRETEGPSTAVWFPELSRDSCFDEIDLVPNWELTVDYMLQGDFRGEAAPTDLLCVFDDFHTD
jgi:hypothetical protein